ncbi:glycoside hydrolase family 32 protein [Nocardioides panacis]|uniref:beta-fructofuranosidase n=1 Tax=Nocardioides panacis TaxID=2849501 RepID=A0A975SXV6_9ACTN|nr:glycoside hydrolase family 32 protein [Nocardioides panacis]QWZ07886.1 glycoside hydrolase family 32 protein [Nocardioides panacis]
MTAPPDPAFPALHARPAAGWVNDPNGLAHVDGRFHVFFQHNPAAPVHDAITWGHVSSADLVSWRAEPPALVPRPGGHDARGCWTGCLTVEDGVPTAVYSGVADTSGASHVLLARSGDGLATWVQDPRPAVGMPQDPTLSDVRDPFLFELDGHRYAVQGAGSPHGSPALLVYDADDLASWRELGRLLGPDDPVAGPLAPADIWECPNLVRLGDRWLLVLSLWRADGDRSPLAGVRWLVGDLLLEGGTPRFVPATGGVLDTGPCFYAPQLLAHDGRVLLWAWSWEHGRSDADVRRAGWAGALTFPRDLRLHGDRLVSRPAAELTGLRAARLDLTPGRPFRAAAYEVELAAGTRSELWLVHADGTSEPVARWETPAEPLQPPRLLVDGSMVEIFAGGPESCTTRGYPRPGSRWRLDVPGTVTAWTLALTPFHVPTRP